MISGSIRNVTIDGVSYDVLGDSNFSEVGSQYMNEAVPTSGKNIRKMTRRVQSVSSVIIACEGSEKGRLETISDSNQDVSMSYETANGDVFRCDGFIEFESRETDENRGTLTLIPRDKWSPFLA